MADAPTPRRDHRAGAVGPSRRPGPGHTRWAERRHRLRLRVTTGAESSAGSHATASGDASSAPSP